MLTLESEITQLEKEVEYYKQKNDPDQNDTTEERTQKFMRKSASERYDAKSHDGRIVMKKRAHTEIDSDQEHYESK